MGGFEDGILVVEHEFMGKVQPKIDVTFFPDFLAKALNRGSGRAGQVSEFHDANVDNIIEIREYVFDDVPFGGSQVFDLAHPGKQIHGQPQIPGMCLKRACLEE